MNKHLVILPTYNEASNVVILVPRIFRFSPTSSILVIDDGSPDGTAAEVKKLQEHFPQLFLVQRNSKSGLGSAYRYGFKWGIERDFDDVIEMDADLSHRVRDLIRMLQTREFDPNADLVIGSRWIEGGSTINWPKRRQILSRTANLYVKFMLDMGVNDSTAGFRIYSSDLLKSIPLDSIKSEGYSFQIEMTRAARRAGAKIVEVPITFRERESGISKMTWKIIIEALVRVTIWGLKRLLRIES